jgi:hypothetical protein
MEVELSGNRRNQRVALALKLVTKKSAKSICFAGVIAILTAPDAFSWFTHYELISTYMLFPVFSSSPSSFYSPV